MNGASVTAPVSLPGAGARLNGHIQEPAGTIVHEQLFMDWGIGR